MVDQDALWPFVRSLFSSHMLLTSRGTFHAAPTYRAITLRSVFTFRIFGAIRSWFTEHPVFCATQGQLHVDHVHVNDAILALAERYARVQRQGPCSF